MRTLLLVLLVLLGKTPSHASERRPGGPSVPTSVAWVASGGYWETKSERGRYRIIVEEGGWEHVKSRIHIEWIAERSKEKRLAVVAAATVSELGDQWTFGSPKIVPSKTGVSLELPATDPHDGRQRKFVLELGAPGRYRIKP